MKIENAKIRENNFLSNKNTLSNRVSAFSEDRRNEITYLREDQLKPYHKQARVIFDQEEIDQLAETIKEHGIQNPLTVLRVDTNNSVFEVISGERRLRAARQVGLINIPCVILYDKEKAEELALIENIQRQNLHPVELANSLKSLVDRYGYGGQLEVGKKLGLSKSQMSEIMKISTFSDEIKTFLLTHRVRGRELYRKISQLKTDKDIILFLKKSIKVEDDEKYSKTKSVSTSVLRISLNDTEFKVQKKFISKLTNEQRELLKKKLEELIFELS